MTRDEALLKLISVEPIGHSEMLTVTGWPINETLDSAHRLLAQSLVVKASGHYCLPDVAGALREINAPDTMRSKPAIAPTPTHWWADA